MKIIWHDDTLLEVDWIRDIFGSHIDAETTDLDQTCFDDDAIHVVNSNRHPLAFYEPYFAQCRLQCRRLVLFHVGDEFFSGGYRLYRHFDAVIRNFATYLADAPGILTIPEGFPNGTRTTGAAPRPIEARRLAWSFTGEIKASRVDMAAALQGLEPSLLTRTASISDRHAKKLSKSDYDAVLEDTIFSPCPMGNVILETWRFYESLELGCIPLVERRSSLDYFNRLFGPHPIPTFSDWASARRYAEASLADRSALARLQSEIGAWWMARKDETRANVLRHVDGPSHAQSLANFASATRNRYPVLHEPLRIAELLRHQSSASLRRRLMRPGAPIKRIMRESLRQRRFAPRI